MPELPEVEALARAITADAVGERVAAVELLALSALKTFDPPLDALVGRELTGASRRGKWLLVAFGAAEPLLVAVHLSRAGWVRWRRDAAPAKRPAKLGKGPLALRIRFESGAVLECTEAGTEKRLAVHVVRDPADVERIASLGPDPLDPAFDVDALARVLAGRNAQLKGVLTDQTVLAGVGNAYSDEALHAARLSPFKVAGKLTPEEVARLHEALVGVLRAAVERSDGLPPTELKGEKKSGLRVHGRTGEACPACGDTVRDVSFATSSLQYCPTCQTGGKPLADRRLSRLLR